MAAPALVSFLGFPGWAAVHLQLPGQSDPARMAQRLRLAQQAADPDASAAVLLASFLRQHADAEPLARPWGALPAGGHRLSHRYRIVCREERRAPLVAAWCWDGGAGGWRACCRPLALPGFLERFAPEPDEDHAAVGRIETGAGEGPSLLAAQ